MSGNLYVRQPKELPQIIWSSSSDCRQIPSVSMPRSCPKHAWLFDAACAMSGCKKIVIFKKITSAVSKSVSKFVEIQSRLTFSCKSWKNVSQIIDFADFLSGFYDFLHFGRFLRFKNTILCKFADKILKRRKFCQRRHHAHCPHDCLPPEHSPSYQDKIIPVIRCTISKTFLRDT